MVQAETKRGFQYTLTDERLDDFETVELLMEAERDPSKIIYAAQRLLGDDQYQSLKEHIRKDGKISTVAMMEEINDILLGSQTAKN